MSKINIRGLYFDNFTIAEALDMVFSFLKEEKNHIVVTPNSEIVQMCLEKPELRALYNNADLSVADGIGVVYASKILKTPLKERVSGFDLANALLNEAKAKEPIFLFGGAPGVASEAAEKIKERFPNACICGTNNGFFDDSAPIIEKINSSGAKILFVCLGAPKQEKWMHENKDKLSTRVMLGLGGSLDVFSGRTKRASKIFITLGLEWFYRLLTQPSRFIRMLSLPKFLVGTIFHSLTGKKEEER